MIRITELIFSCLLHPLTPWVTKTDFLLAVSRRTVAKIKENQDVDSIPKIFQTDIIRIATEGGIAYKILRVKQIECLTRSYGNKSWFELLVWRKNYAQQFAKRNVDAWRWNTVQILIRSWWTNLVFIFTSTETSFCDWVEMTDWFRKRHTKSKHSATLLVWCREMWKSHNALDRPQSSSWMLFKTMAGYKAQRSPRFFSSEHKLKS